MLNNNTLVESFSGFAEYARQKGLPISTSEVIDGVSAVKALIPFSLHEMNSILQFCLVKSVVNLEKYNNTFWEYFLHDEKMIAALAVFQNQQEKEIKENVTQGQKQTKDESNSTPNKPTKEPEKNNNWQSSLMQCNIPESLKSFLKKEKQLSATLLSHQPLTDSNKKAITIAISELAQKNKILGQDLPDILMSIKEYTKLAHTVEKMRSMSGKKPAVHVSHSELHSWTSPALYSADISPSLLNTNLDHVSKDQLAQLIIEAEKAAAGLKPNFARNPGLTHRKLALDYKKTLHKSLTTFGEPFHLIASAKRRRLRRLVTICDVSGSVKNVTGLLLAFLYGLHQSFEGRAKHYAFVSEIDEITSYFSTDSYEGCFDQIMRSAAVDYRGYSNYGNMLERLWEKNRNVLDHETVVIFLGDARTNRYDPCPDIMKNICAVTKKAFFLNPECRSKWYSGDSAVRQYEKIIQMVEINKFANLLGFLNKLPEMVVAA